MENVIIIGSGPAGLTAGIYAARAQLEPLVVMGPKPGGQLTETAEIENFPGFSEPVNGQKLMDEMRRQAEACGVRMLSDEVASVALDGPVKRLATVGGAVLEARAVVVATGAGARRLGAPDEQTYRGRGVSYCATCDGFFFRGKDVAVIGGGDTAMADVLTLRRMCRSVTVVHRRAAFRASKVLARRVLEAENVRVVWNAQVAAFLGDGRRLSGLRLASTVDGTTSEIAVSGAFVAIGHEPRTAFLGDALAMDGGYVRARGTQTSVPGVFAAGDCVDSVYRQAVFAAGQGAAAALDAERFLAT